MDHFITHLFWLKLKCSGKFTFHLFKILMDFIKARGNFSTYTPCIHIYLCFVPAQICKSGVSGLFCEIIWRTILNPQDLIGVL